MVRRLLLSFAFALTIPSARAAELIIIPVHASNLISGGWEWKSTVRVSNPWDVPVFLRALDFLPHEPIACILPCYEGRWTIEPGETREIEGPGFQLTAFTLESNLPLAVSSEIVSRPPTMTPVAESGRETQVIEPGRAWIRPGAVAWIPAVEIGQSVRANLFLVNPNPEPITVTYVITGRLEPREKSVVVRGASLAIERLEPELHDCPAGCFTMLTPYRIDLKADAPFYAGASSIDGRTNDAVFRSPVFAGGANRIE